MTHAKQGWAGLSGGTLNVLPFGGIWILDEMNRIYHSHAFQLHLSYQVNKYLFSLCPACLTWWNYKTAGYMMLFVV